MISIPLKLDIRPYSEGIKSALNIASIFGKQSEILMKMKAPKPDFTSINAEVKKLEREYERLAAEELKVAQNQQRVNKSVKDFPDTAHVKRAASNYQELSLAISSNIYMFEKLGGYVMRGINEYGKESVAVDKLTNGLRNLNEVRNIEGLLKQAEQLQGFTMYPDEEIINAQAMLTTFRKTSEQVQLLTPRILDMAAAYEKDSQSKADLQQIAVAVGKVNDETAGALRRYGVELSNNDIAQLKSLEGLEQTRYLVKILDSNFQGLAETVGKSVPGQVAILERKFGDLWESMGAGIIKQSQSDMSAFSKEVKSTGDNINVANLAAEMLGRSIAILLEYGTPLGVFKRSFDVIQKSINLANSDTDGFLNRIRQIADILKQNPSTALFGGLYDQIANAYEGMSRLIGLWKSESEFFKFFFGNSNTGGDENTPYGPELPPGFVKPGKGGDMPGDFNIGGIAGEGTLFNKKSSGTGKTKELNDVEELEEEIKKLEKLIEKFTAKYGANSGIVLKKTSDLLNKQKEYNAMMEKFNTIIDAMPFKIGDSDRKKIAEEVMPIDALVRMEEQDKKAKRNKIISGDDYQFASLMLKSLGEEWGNALSDAWNGAFGEANSFFEKLLKSIGTSVLGNLFKMGSGFLLNALFPGAGNIIGTLFGGTSAGSGGGPDSRGLTGGNSFAGYGERYASVNNYHTSVLNHTTQTIIPDVRLSGQDLVISFNRASGEINAQLD